MAKRNNFSAAELEKFSKKGLPRNQLRDEFLAKKTGRGRPRNRQLDAFECLGFVKQTTRRGRANHLFMDLACVVLKFDTRPPRELAWLRNPKSPAGPAVKRRTILAALGRIPDAGVMTRFAEHLCEAKPLVSDAIPMIRRMQVNYVTEELRRAGVPD
jgi:hypothetical protein